MRSGSVFIKAVNPDYQFDIQTEYGGKRIKVGQGFRLRDKLITANHVVQDLTELFLVSPKGEIKMDARRFKLVEGDLAVCLINSHDIHDLQIPSARICKNIPEADSGLFCRISAFGESSLGLLIPHKAFGFVKYTGSTIGGFSGAPFTVGSTVYGMHLGGGSENLGYSGAYISMLLRRYEEDSIDFVMAQIDEAVGEVEFQRSPYSPDEYRVRVDGAYYMLDAQDVDRIKKRRKQPAFVDEPHYDEERASIPESIQEVESSAVLAESSSFFESSGNSRSPATSVVAGPAGKPLVEGTVLKPKKAARRVTISSQKPPLVGSDTDGQTVTPAQLYEVSVNIAKSLKLLRQGLAQSSPKRSKKQSKTPDYNSEVGRLISLNSELERIISATGLKKV